MHHNYQKSFAFTDELIVDNFAGGGGASLGIEMALGRPIDIAINHDPQAIEMHAYNHSQTHHYCESVWDVNPREAVGNNRVKLAWFSPDCKHFSKAKGGKPVEKTIRGLAWVTLRWAATVKPRVIMLENVEEFMTWGPVVNGKPCEKRKGKTFGSFTRALERQGYQVEYKILRACDFGAPTIRKRLFMIARRDGLPIVWPKPTHGPKGYGLKPYETAASIVDWSIPCPSIFERERPLVDNTLKRIAKGLDKFVFNNPHPFIVQSDGGGFAPILDRQFGSASCNSIEKPVGTIMPQGGGKTALVSAFLAKHYGGVTGVKIDTPFPTITAKGTQNQVVTASLSKTDHSPEVRAFLIKYYGAGIGLSANEPLHTISTKDRFGLVTVAGEDYQIIDIGMRMLTPKELYRAQGFPGWYRFDCLTKTQAVAKCGNSVSPLVAKALVEANLVGKVQSSRNAA